MPRFRVRGGAATRMIEEPTRKFLGGAAIPIEVLAAGAEKSTEGGSLIPIRVLAAGARPMRGGAALRVRIEEVATKGIMGGAALPVVIVIDNRPSDGALTYLLRDEFTTNQAGPLGSPRICEPGPGQLFFGQTDGQFSIVASELNWTAPIGLNWGLTTDFYGVDDIGSGFARPLGRVVKFRLIMDIDERLAVGWNPDTSPDFPRLFDAALYMQVPPALYSTGCDIPADTSGILRDTFALDEWLGVAVVLSPYDALLGNHWYPGHASPGDFDTGWHIFVNFGSGWRLVWFRDCGSNDPLYPAFSNGNCAGRMDYVRVPMDTDSIWQPLLTPECWDEFTGPNGTSLDAHAPTYGGQTWVEYLGNWDLQGDQAAPDGTGDARCYVETDEADVWVADICRPGASGAIGVVFRKAADTGGGANEWFFFIRADFNSWELRRFSDGGNFLVDSGVLPITAGVPYEVRIRCVGDQINAYVDKVEVSSVTDGTHQSNTWHGIWGGGNAAHRIDNFLVLRYGSGNEYDAALDSF